jgi:hypothetical protein
VWEVGERRLHRDEAVHQVRLVVLEAQVEDVRLAAGRDVARHLEGHRRLAGALGATDQHQLPGTQAGADGLVERREAERDRLVLGQMARRDPLIEVDEHVQRRPRCHAPVVGIEPPIAPSGRLGDVGFEIGAHAVGSSSEAGALGAHAARVG